MVRELHFTPREFNSLTSGLSLFHFFAKTTVEAENLRNKAHLWYKALAVNIWPSASKSMHMLTLDGVEWVSTKAEIKGLTALLSTMWRETHPLVADLLSLMTNNTRELRARVDWAADYELLTMHYHDLNTCSINVED